MSEPLKATFFTLQRRDRTVLLPATLVFIVIMALLVGVFVALNWGRLLGLYEFILSAPAQQPSDEQASQLIWSVFGLFGGAMLLLFPMYLTIAAYETACLRWMIRGEAPGLFGLTIDNDVWRVWGVYWCWLVTHMIVSFAMSIATMPLIFMMMGEMMRDPSPEAMMRWQLTVQLPISLLQYLPLIFIGVRFGPAAATSVARKRFSFVDAWKVTEDRFWALFGSFAVLWLIAGLLIAAAATPIVLYMWPYFWSMWPTPTEETTEAYLRAYTASEALIRIGIAYGAMTIVGWWLALMSYGVNARAALVALEEGKIQVDPAS